MYAPLRCPRCLCCRKKNDCTTMHLEAHVPKGQEEPSPGQNERSGWHPGYRTTHIPCALNRRSPAEGKGNGATRRRPKGKAKWQQGTLEVPSGNTFQTFPLAPAGRGPSGYILPRVSFATLILPWARFLLGFQPVQGPSFFISSNQYNPNSFLSPRPCFRNTD